MELSDINNPIWKNLVLNKVQVHLNFFAANILLSRWRLSLQSNSSPNEIEKAKYEIFDLYLRNMDLPNAKKDISLLLNK